MSFLRCPRTTFAALAVVVLFAGWASPAKALTNDDIAGIYQGTSVATLPNGQSVTATVSITLKASGKEKVKATVDGQTATSKGTFVFATDQIIVGQFSTGQFTAFAELNGNTLTLTVLAKQDATGQIVSEVTTLTLMEKL